MSYQQCIIIGNLGKNPELRYLQNGRAVCSFSVAVTERWTDRTSNEKREKTTWFSVSAWGPLGETCNQYLTKGRQVMIIGTVSARAYTDKAGQPAASLDITATDVRFLGGQGSDGQNGERSAEFGGGQPPSDLSDIPF